MNENRVLCFSLFESVLKKDETFDQNQTQNLILKHSGNNNILEKKKVSLKLVFYRKILFYKTKEKQAWQQHGIVKFLNLIILKVLC